MTTDLTNEELLKIIEGLLFVASEPVTVNHLATAIDCTPGRVEKVLRQLQEASQERGIRLQQQGKKVQLVSAPELTDYIEEFLGLSVSGKLSAAALEALAIVAYRQPVTRPEIEAIRGVNSDGVLRTLLNKGLVEEVGRLDSVGHPSLFGTSFEFLRYFGLEKIEELPELELLEMPPVEGERILDGEGEAVFDDELPSDDVVSSDDEAVKDKAAPSDVEDTAAAEAEAAD